MNSSHKQYQTLRLCVGKRPDQQGVNETEYRGICTNRQCKGGNRDQNKCRTFCQKANSESEFLKHKQFI